jgi:dTDP-4-amino-4,6-dideoxygalactose transaminase
MMTSLPQKLLRRRLLDEGVETRPLFPPQCDQKSWMERFGRSKDALPVARRLAAFGLYLSVSPHLALAEVRRIAAILLRVIKA